MTDKPSRPVFLVKFQPTAGTGARDLPRLLLSMLKRALRSYNLKCLSIEELKAKDNENDE
jgi:hypothetical protein